MIRLDRRLLLKAGSLGLGALAAPGLAAALSDARGFTHNVASGEPRQNSVMLWTRFVPKGGGSARLQAEISESGDFRSMVAANRQMKWAETGRRGYLTVELTPDRATGEWLLMDTIRSRSTRLASAHRLAALHGSNRLTA